MASATFKKADAVEMPNPAIHQMRFERRVLTPSISQRK